MQKFTIRSDEAGQRMDKYLHKLLKNAPSSFYYKMLRKKNITLNGKKADGTEILQLGDTVSCFFSDETFEKFAGYAYSESSSGSESSTGEHKIGSAREDGDLLLYQKAYQTLRNIRIVHEDKDVLLIHKPVNVLSQQAKQGDLSANEWLLGYLLGQGVITKETLRTFKPGVVNRLDRNTTGLLICSKSLRGAQIMSDIVRNRSVEKYYLAVVAGHFAQTESFHGYIVKNEKNNLVSFYPKKEQIPKALQKEAAPVQTSFEPIHETKEYTVLRVLLHTGKTHQIRAHLRALGHPILGDPKYGNNALNRKFQVKHQLLHAYELRFPKIEGMELSGKTIICEPPEDFTPFL